MAKPRWIDASLSPDEHPTALGLVKAGTPPTLRSSSWENYQKERKHTEQYATTDLRTQSCRSYALVCAGCRHDEAPWLPGCRAFPVNSASSTSATGTASTSTNPIRPNPPTPPPTTRQPPTMRNTQARKEHGHTIGGTCIHQKCD